MKYTKCRICSPESRLLWMMFLTTGFMLVELIVGHITSSMALVADSFHMMSDVLSIIVAYISVRYVHLYSTLWIGMLMGSFEMICGAGV